MHVFASRRRSSPLFHWLEVEQFQNYKKAERKALDLLAEMTAVTTNPVDIELALIVAVFELHKQSISAETPAGIIQEHLKALVTHYGQQQG